MDYYGVLGLSSSAEPELIEKAYRIMARKYHPDRSGEDTAARFQHISEAYDILANPRLRRMYDQNALPGRLAGRDGIGADAFQILNLRFEQAARGGRIQLHRITTAQNQQPIDVDIPKAVDDGDRLRLPQLGQPSPTGGINGDLILIVVVESHPQFRREGLDLFVETDVSVQTATLGGNVVVKTLDGPKEIHIPAGTSGGAKVRLRSGGLRDNHGRGGDLYAVARIQLSRNSKSPDKQTHTSAKT